MALQKTFLWKLIHLSLWLVALAPPNLHARTVWTVTAPPELDARIKRQLQELARAERAEARFVEKASEIVRSRGLSIELQQEENLDAFVQSLKQLAPASADLLTPEVAREGFILSSVYRYRLRIKNVRIQAANPRGFHYALGRLPDLLRPPSSWSKSMLPPVKSVAVTPPGPAGLAETVVVADFPSFTERGIVEGFYGKAWSHEDRLRMIRFEGTHGMNVYYYAPKDDPYHRKLWREPYPSEQLKRLGELAQTARSNFVDLCFAISPGLSMLYSSEEDFSKLTAKLASVSQLGISCFGLFLDDVPRDLQSPEDKARFKTLAEAHAGLINRLYHHLKSQSSENRLVVTPTTYTNEWGSRDYIRELGEGVEADVPLVWTGTKVVSPEITVAQAQEWGALLRRNVLIWDNFPVNDGVSWRLNLGPLRGRDANLPLAARGLFSNPMNQPHASLIPLQTIADYLWNPATYDPEKSHRHAVLEQAGNDAPARLAPFLSTYSDYWWDENIFEPLFVERRTPIDVAKVRQQIGLLETNLRALRKQTRFRNFVRELAPFPPKMRFRLAEVLNDPAFEHLPDGRLLWREDYDVLRAVRFNTPPTLDGDFAKWKSLPNTSLDQKAQIFAGPHLWRGPGKFSARFALGWDETNLYVGLEITDPEIYQPFTGRDILRGDLVGLVLETAFRKNFQSIQADGDEYHLLFSPGNFAGVGASLYSDEEYLPPRPAVRDYNREVKTGWKKTPTGISGDIAIPAAWFEGGRFQAGYEIGFGFSAQKAFPLPEGFLGGDEDIPRIVFRSKADRTFPVHFGNPSSYQRLVLTESNLP